MQARLSALEARYEIGQLPIRYALAVDGRDVETWLSLFVPDIDCGRHGVGREVLRSIITPILNNFYRSMHQICGHRVELLDESHAKGSTYCRAEHEVGDRFVVVSICYEDEYQKVGEEWLFSRRKERHWYASDVLERPQLRSFDGWDAAGRPKLPEAFPTWRSFWAGVDTSAITDRPVPAPE
jgi:hypothetical protein